MCDFGHFRGIVGLRVRQASKVPPKWFVLAGAHGVRSFGPAFHDRGYKSGEAGEK